MATRKVMKTVEEFWNTCARCGKEYMLSGDPEKVPIDQTAPCHGDWCGECRVAEYAETARAEYAYLIGSVVVDFRLTNDYMADLESIRIRSADGRLFDVSEFKSYDDAWRGLDVEEVKP